MTCQIQGANRLQRVFIVYQMSDISAYPSVNLSPTRNFHIQFISIFVS